MDALASANAAASVAPECTSPCYLDVAEEEATARLVLVLGFYSVILDPTELSAPPCTRHVALAALARLMQKVDLDDSSGFKPKWGQEHRGSWALATHPGVGRPCLHPYVPPP